MVQRSNHQESPVIAHRVDHPIEILKVSLFNQLAASARDEEYGQFQGGPLAKIKCALAGNPEDFDLR